jgi:hypothetical protein
MMMGILSFSSMMWNTRINAAHRSAGEPVVRAFIREGIDQPRTRTRVRFARS